MRSAGKDCRHNAKDTVGEKVQICLHCKPKSPLAFIECVTEAYAALGDKTGVKIEFQWE